MNTKRNQTVSLVLGSGGARGLAHIGIINWLEENRYRIQSIAGSSIGALVGGIYAAGKLGEYESWVRTISKFDIFSLLDFSFGYSGLVKGEKLMAKLRKLVGEIEIESLPITFTAVAADIVREREVWISKGPLFDAIRASISLPLFFTPFRYKGRLLIDGGVFNPVPITPTFHDLTDMTIAVNLNAPPVGEEQKTPIKIELKDDNELSGLNGFREKIAHFFAGFQSDDREEKPKEWDIFFIANQSFDAMQGMIARQKLAAHPPDVTINIPRNACGFLDYDCARKMISLGYQEAEQQLSNFKPV
ncbi:MAG: patatin-like phospholipase family protein [Desulfobacterales bacterium]